MKRTFSVSLAAAFVVAAGVLAGCPVFDDNPSGSSSGCFSNDCSTSSTGNQGNCNSPSDCKPNQTCGSDHNCHDGDCTFWTCVDGYTCVTNSDHIATCEPNGAGGSGGATSTSTSSSTSSTGGSGGGGVVYCGNPKDCAAGQTCAPDGTCKAGDCAANSCIFGYACQQDGTCKSTNPAACGSDSDCAATGMGYACVSGICTSPDDQCFDQTQCAAKDKCAAGKCTVACVTNADCGASGYACDVAKGICSNVTKACTITNDCGGPSNVCVDGACVPRSMANGTCPAGSDWVENGCIPSQKAVFVCITDGMLGDGQPGDCALGSMCLHHSCYISCESPNQNACMNLPEFNQCKPVTTSSGPHDVCGSNQNLGGECDPTAQNSCNVGKICIDGFCK